MIWKVQKIAWKHKKRHFSWKNWHVQLWSQKKDGISKGVYIEEQENIYIYTLYFYRSFLGVNFQLSDSVWICSSHNEAYFPFCWISWLWLPCSIINPFSITKIISAWITVESRWAIIKHVFPFAAKISSLWTCFSVIVSNDEVASSRMQAFGCFRINRAIAIRCFSPPDSARPRSPTLVSRPSLNFVKSRPAELIASWISLSLDVSLDFWIFLNNFTPPLHIWTALF